MCRRFSNPYTWSELLELYVPSVDGQNQDWKPNFNIAPATQVPVVVTQYGTRRAELMRWGLIPAWSKEISAPPRFNARSNSVHFNPTFRGAWEAGRRCIVPAGSFFAWRKKDKQPFAIARTDKRPMAFAGLWEQWKPDDKMPLRSMAIITCEANKLIAEFDDHMPVILGEENWPVWLGEQSADECTIQNLLKPFDAAQMTSWPIRNLPRRSRGDSDRTFRPYAVET